MKTNELSLYGFEEMSSKEMKEVDGVRLFLVAWVVFAVAHGVAGLSAINKGISSEELKFKSGKILHGD